MSKILDKIQEPNDIKKIKPNDYYKLAEEIRRFLVEKVSKQGGHLSSNLGVVELTIAIHLSMTLPNDRIIWDVGHQSYTHKILTGRKEQFDTLRQYEGMSGFPKKAESDCDAFDTGHSSTSISAALGLAKARDLNKEKAKIYAIIGDGALSGGLAYEALNNAARLKTNFVIVLNDNNMSISENVGGMSTYLGKIRTNLKYQDFKDDVESTLKKIPKIGEKLIEKIRKSKDSLKRLLIPGMLFEDMGITYIGPIDGHNIDQLLTAFKSAEKVKGAVIVHVITKKGKGYLLAEQNPSKFHGIEPFYRKTGQPRTPKIALGYTDVFSKKILTLAKEYDNLAVITAAMPSGTGLTEFGNHYPERFFDVGIAEEHAVTFAAGLAAGGIIPIVAIYSTFLQRAYDQILHDVCINSLHVIFAIDRAGIVGKDGKTHQGIFDLSYLSCIPNLMIMAPKNALELEDMLEYAMILDVPIAIRYPRGAAYMGLEDKFEPIVLGKSEILYKESNIAILALGSMVETALKVRNLLKAKGLNVTLVNARFVAPLDTKCIDELIKNHDYIVTMEENVSHGGYGEKVSDYICKCCYTGINFIKIAIPDEYLTHGDANILKEKLELDAESITRKILKKVS